MQRLRSYYDGDRDENFSLPTNHQTERNRHELYCGLCGESFFVDDFVFEDITRVIEETLENPFVCEDCLEEYEELSSAL